jgi:putative hydrolase of the HAD superfamily
MNALLLDFGSVISKSLFERQPLIEKKLNLPPGSLTWKGPFDPDSDLLWMRMQEDDITEREYWNTRAKEIGERLGKTGWDMATLLKAIGGEKVYSQVLRPQALKTIERCKKAGKKVGILSNEIELFTGKEWVENLPFIHQLDSFYDASNSDILKPDPRAYRMALEQLGEKPADVLFVDDQLRNVAGAMKCGLRTLHFDITQPDACYDYVQAVMQVKKHKTVPLGQ